MPRRVIEGIVRIALRLRRLGIMSFTTLTITAAGMPDGLRSARQQSELLSED